MTARNISRLLAVLLVVVPMSLAAQDLAEDIEKALLEAAVSNAVEQVEVDPVAPEPEPTDVDDDARRQINELKATLKSSGEAMHEVEMQLKEEKKLRSRIEDDLKKARREIEDLDDKLKSGKGQEASDVSKALRKDIKDLEDRLKKEAGQREDAEKELAKAQEDLAEKEKALDDTGNLNKRVKDLEKQLNKEAGERQDAEAALAKTEKALAEKEKALSAVTSEDKGASDLLKQVEQLEGALAGTAAKLKAAEDQLLTKDKEQALLKDLVEKQRADMDARIAELEKVAASGGQDQTEAEKTLKAITKQHAQALREAGDREVGLKNRVLELEGQIAKLQDATAASQSEALRAAEKRIEMVTREMEGWKDRNVKAKADFLKTEQQLKDEVVLLTHEKKRLTGIVEEQAGQSKVLKKMLEDRGDDLAKRLKDFEAAAEATAEKIGQLNDELAAEKESLRVAREAQELAEARARDLEKGQPELSAKVARLESELEKATTRARDLDADLEKMNGEHRAQVAALTSSLAEARRDLKAVSQALEGRKRLFAFLATGKPDSEKSPVDRIKELKEDVDVAAVAVEELKDEIRRLKAGGRATPPKVGPTARPPVAAAAARPAAVAGAANPERERLLQRLMEIRKQYEAANANADQIKRKLIDELKGGDSE